MRNKYLVKRSISRKNQLERTRAASWTSAPGRVFAELSFPTCKPQSMLNITQHSSARGRQSTDCRRLHVTAVYQHEIFPSSTCSLSLSGSQVFLFLAMVISIARLLPNWASKADRELQRTACDNQSMTREGIANHAASPSFSSLRSLHQTIGIAVCFALMCGG